MKRPISFPHQLLRLLLAPVVLVQARRTARRSPRLDPASGAEHGVTAGTEPTFRFVLIGDSTAAGVGAPVHAEALPGFLAEALQGQLQRSVAWSVTGKRGATARRVVTDLVPALNGTDPDLVVITVGINDLIRRRSLEQWGADLTDLISTLRARYGNAEVIVAGMPPVHRFPAIPQPMRLVIGAQARAMDRIMREVAHANGAVHAPMDEAMASDRELFASDGIHPSSDGYRVWANDLAGLISPLTVQPAH
ncbi:SGNH/GDSL hydrolase family protein [Actinomadura barringtoniae]|uniref:SGNH/GDSL hydrolase family protein n=1 Tax=Actinomadura barringtoniae TaxID=1427535 RepID=A0A939P5M2_9ACTN|nr:SGNH/GDSL hydrolase family protein [Actinomadura barringtoniae]MBO2445618.1 SGNH/GDSL hydrolase family protein [Actinomadura barringtoniae]